MNKGSVHIRAIVRDKSFYSVTYIQAYISSFLSVFKSPEKTFINPLIYFFPFSFQHTNILIRASGIQFSSYLTIPYCTIVLFSYLKQAQVGHTENKHIQFVSSFHFHKQPDLTHNFTPTCHFRSKFCSIYVRFIKHTSQVIRNLIQLHSTHTHFKQQFLFHAGNHHLFFTLSS